MIVQKQRNVYSKNRKLKFVNHHKKIKRWKKQDARITIKKRKAKKENIKNTTSF